MSILLYHAGFGKRSILKRDPFHVHEIADYEIIEFNPTKYHADFAFFIK